MGTLMYAQRENQQHELEDCDGKLGRLQRLSRLRKVQVSMVRPAVSHTSASDHQQHDQPNLDCSQATSFSHFAFLFCLPNHHQFPRGLWALEISNLTLEQQP